MITCEICGVSVDETNRRDVVEHYRTHTIMGPHAIKRVYHEGVRPTCKCGCGQLTSYDNRFYRFSEYVWEHRPRIIDADSVVVAEHKCTFCGADFTKLTRKELVRHYWQEHRISGGITVSKLYHAGQVPTCACGCGEMMAYNSESVSFPEYAIGHNTWQHRANLSVNKTGTSTPKKAKITLTEKGSPQPLRPVVYSITNIITRRQYVGVDSYWPNRRHHHLRLLRMRKHPNKHIQHAFNCDGEAAFKFDLLEENICRTELGTREKYWIAKLDTYVNGYNQSMGGERARINPEAEKLEVLVSWQPKKLGVKLPPKSERIVRQSQSESFGADGLPCCVCCDASFHTKEALYQHFWYKHRIPQDHTILHFYHAGIVPLCACGCGADVTYNRHERSYNKYARCHWRCNSIKKPSLVPGKVSQ
jgi:hypothetical protein